MKMKTLIQVSLAMFLVVTMNSAIAGGAPTPTPPPGAPTTPPPGAPTPP